MDGCQSDSMNGLDWRSIVTSVFFFQGGRFIFWNSDSCELSSTWSETKCVWIHPLATKTAFFEMMILCNFFSPAWLQMCFSTFYAPKVLTLNWVFNKSMHGEMRFSGFSSTLSSQTITWMFLGEFAANLLI